MTGAIDTRHDAWKVRLPGRAAKWVEASISLRRFSSTSLRRYACSAFSPKTCASAVSVISRGKLETLLAQPNGSFA
jgi:hypothetical protein